MNLEMVKGAVELKISIQTKMIAIFLVLIIAPIALLGISSYLMTEDILKDEIKTEYMTNIDNINTYYIENFLRGVESCVKVWANDASVHRYYKNDTGIKTMMQQWEGYMKTNNNIQWIYVGTQTGKYYLVPKDPMMPKNYDPRTRMWYKEAVGQKGQLVWTEPYKDAGSGGMMVTATMTIQDQDNPQKIIGAFAVDLELRKLSEILKSVNLGDDGVVFLMDKNGYIVADSDFSKIGTYYGNTSWEKTVLGSYKGSAFTKFNNKPVYMSYTTVKNTDWKLVGLVTERTLSRQVDPIKNRTIMVGFISVFIAIIIAIRFSKGIGSKIERLISYMKLVENGDLTVRSYYDGNDEFKELNINFNKMVHNLSKHMNEVKILSITDGLTGLYNHRYVTEALDRSMRNAIENETPLSIMMMDIDNFKSINDNYGHVAGDDVLVDIAKVLTGNMRGDDIIGRYGGEEFLVVMPNVDIVGAEFTAERIRTLIEKITIGEIGGKVTVSIGVKELCGESYSEFINEADKLLYQAKRNGKNRVERTFDE